MTEFEKTENKSVDSTVAYDVKSSSKTRYDEFRTNAMIWANSANTQVGDTKIFNNRGKGFALVEATENGYIEVESGSYDELRSNYEQTYRKTTNKVYEYSKVLQSEQGRDFFDLFNDENRTNVGRYSEKIGEERFQNDTSRNNEYLQSSDKEKLSLKTNVEKTKQLHLRPCLMLSKTAELLIIRRIIKTAKKIEHYLPLL